MNQINEKIVDLKTKLKEDQNQRKDNSNSDSKSEIPNRGILLMDTTTCPQDIAYPTDLNRLNNVREKSEMLIDLFYQKNFTVKSHELTEKKCKTGKIIRKGVGQQLRYLKRNINHIVDLLDIYEGISSSTALIYNKTERSTTSNSKLYFFGETK